MSVIWHKAHMLEGKTLFTITNKPFQVTQVTEDKIYYDPTDGTVDTHWTSRRAIEYLASQKVEQEEWSRIKVQELLKASDYWQQEQQCTSYIYIILCEIGIAQKRDMRKNRRTKNRI